MKNYCSSIAKETPVYHTCHFVWDFLTPDKHVSLRLSALPFKTCAIWRTHDLCEEIQSLQLDRPVPTCNPLLINRMHKNCCALLHLDFIYGNLVRWFEGKYTICNVDYGMLFENIDNLRTTKIPPGNPKADLDQTRETLSTEHQQRAPLDQTLDTRANGPGTTITNACTTAYKL
jgi:hypothetical protein